ncbi:MAG: UDP-4-amino-4,6-dideoxy-N-acetyl-beta-L-altrosamine N-acetyltransferase [Paraglaciecola sp.]|uniref:UDP-4-amino-4, 6-dideoxy-N-acetyl-beta-L-altrosamine N-acetyltransferase n=1 Tax=Paraglaciecola sp. TaxID=1920173 RepID=UPI00273D379C|nr:UDP-4-amino-4,6-dideoxy-N-acetyl-beta-L-altrosamine N-acetyltransferase [Paraglaciecola sp.]MDP5030342.1 UDP-4-amino-4,6-dideoxy-N-acetyl-beta-L-altrosamine N-acetyltransferase [Paraglaciecola sp.]MDP5133924.1 UDP-4-amino-4,6-dideoxy-N-acetyl-beta-L-altrosamine N-acetyltransferase [Paraglaciecola sp.]
MENSKNERMQSRLPTHRFEPLVEAQLELVWKWRNSDRVRKNMHDLNLIAWQEHLNWFSALKCDASRHFFIMWQNDRPIGILNFSKLDTSSPEWGCYLGETDVWPGSGIILELAALDYASHNPIFTHLDAQVLSFNNAANKLHQVFEYERIKSVPAGQRNGQSFDILHYRYPLDLWSQKRDKVLAKLPKNIKLVAASIQFGN